MYLKSLEIQGFKSFPDKVKLQFDKGLTAVVGPNGSGKSNIGDAVRWVLGEQSSKTLRGAKMEDVIFAGTQFRKSVGFAQVTLNIDNSKGVLLVPADEVSVTRKLYRSGESEYLINGSQVRLKDVCELFMDTGLGKDGYSIVGQGRVAEIVSAKSNERREIFEEAAGISKFRYRKAEAERRLLAAHDNILRLKDIINELEVRVEPLRIQSEKAAKFIEFSEKKKALEVSVWVKHLDELKQSMQDLEEKILVNNTEYENLDADILRLEEKIQGSYKAMQESNVKLETLQSKILETERSNGQINADIAVYENDIRHGNETIEGIIKQQESAKLSTGEISDKIALQKQKAAELDLVQASTNEKLGQVRLELDTLISETGNFDKSFEGTSTELNQFYIKQSEYTFAIASSESSFIEINEQLSLGKRQQDELSAAIIDLKQENNEIADGLSDIEEKFSEHNNKIVGYTRLYESKAQKLDVSKKSYEQALFQLKEKQQRVQLLSDLENSMEGFSHSVKEVIKASKSSRISGIKGSIAQLIKVDGKYSIAIETALGAALQNVVVENEEIAKRCINLLKEQNAGRATFLPITSVKGNTLTENGLSEHDGFIAVASDLVTYDPEYSGIIRSLLGRIVIAEDIDFAAIISKKYGYKFKIVTLDGQVVNAGGSFTGGSTSRSSGVLTRKNEIDDLKNQIEKLTKNLEVLKADTAKLQAETDKLSFDIIGEKDEISKITEDKIRFQSEQKRIAAMLEQTNSQLENTVSQILRLNERLSDLNVKKKQAVTDLANCEKEIEEKEKQISETQERKDTLHQKREELSAEISTMKIKEMEILKDKEATLQSISQLEENCKQIESNAAELQEKINVQNSIISEKKALIAERKLQLEMSGQSVDNFYEQIKQEQQAHREYEQKATEHRAELKNKNDVKEHYSREVTRLQERKVSIQKDYDTIISEMWEQYQLTRSDASTIAVELDDMLIAQRDLNELKSKIRALGTVNVAAIEEYKEVAERYKFMSEQLNDVEISKRELEKLIAELTDNMRKRFSESFEEINENFKLIFVELFGGGKAELILTNPEDVLESGIEIEVAPPGKVIKNLSLLSGGEQSFVAIAIYFAILKLKPAPFCILDEIEAALDDVNVSKYASYLRNFTSTTQFILITHRRGTMEEADVLYGVTMQEKGISKLLKMEQGEAIEERS